MRTFLFFFVTVFTSLSFVCNAQRKSKVESQKSKDYQTEIQTGADQPEVYLPLLKDKNVGILTNQTGITVKKETAHFAAASTDKPSKEIIVKRDTIHLVDFLKENKIDLKKIYAPEHGFRGTADAGELIKDGKDTKTGLPIISLYGNNKKPTKEQLSGIDVMIFDLQDVGARFYTYISSLHYLMEACAENNIPVIVLDRPNPKGATVDGPVLELKNKSFVGMHPIPVLHGMTIGEYAQMINGEKWGKGAAFNAVVLVRRVPDGAAGAQQLEHAAHVVALHGQGIEVVAFTATALDKVEQRVFMFAVHAVDGVLLAQQSGADFQRGEMQRHQDHALAFELRLLEVLQPFDMGQFGQTRF